MSDKRDNVFGLLASLSTTRPDEEVAITRAAELTVLAGEVIELLGEPTARALSYAIRDAGAARKAARTRAAKREINRVRGTLRLVKGGAA
jgi:hypothetical protein